MSSIEQLAKSLLWKKVQESFASEYRLPFAVLDNTGKPLLITGKKSFLQELIDHKAKTREQEKRKEALQKREGEIVVHEGLSGLYTLLCPVYVNKVCQGAIAIADIRDNRDIQQHFVRIAPTIQMESEELLDAYHQVPLQSFHTIQHLKKILAVLAKMFPDIAREDTKAVQQISHLTQLKKFSELFEATMDLDTLLSMVVKTMVEQYQADNATLLVFEKKRKHYFVQDGKLPYDQIEEVVLKYMQKHQQISIIPNVKNDFSFTHILFSEKNASLLALPMGAKGKLECVLLLYAKPEREWSDEELNSLRDLMTSAYKAIGKAAQFSSVETEAKTDRLTGLFNKGFFLDELQKTLAKYKEKNQATSLVMLDLDDFKQLNDTKGHQKGDEVLQHIGKIIRNTVRKQDVAARFGGEEFVIILPNTKHDEARFVAERIREVVAQETYAGIPLTISAGVACSLNSSSLPSELLKEADQCLYDAKAAGKNCVKSSIIVDRSLGSVQVDKVNDAYMQK